MTLVLQRWPAVNYAGTFLTCESLSPSFSASFLRSGFEIYFWTWNRLSKPERWASENTARLIIPLLGLPRDDVQAYAEGDIPNGFPPKASVRRYVLASRALFSDAYNAQCLL